MSVRAMSAVWELDLPDSDKIVLLALADCANDEGHCWPSVQSLVRKCSKSERTIQASIKRLVDEGHLTRREVPGKGCNYTVHPHHKRIDHRSDNAPAVTAPPQGTAKTPAAAADKPPKNPQSEAKASLNRVIEAWNEEAGRRGFHKVRVLDASRKQMLRLRINAYGVDTMLEAVELAGRSPFLRGEMGDGRKADINIILQPKTLSRVLEGFYGLDDVKPQLGPAERIASLKRMIPLYERDGHRPWADQARRIIADLEGQFPVAGQVAAIVSQTAAARVA